MAKKQATKSDARILRVGVILGGRIIEERLLRNRETVTIGQSAKNTFSVPIEGLPRIWPIFVLKDDEYFLHFNKAMDGRVSSGGSVQPLQETAKQGAQQVSDGFVLPLRDNSRGKIIIGDMTLLFQFVAAPPLQPRPHLPASLRGSLADRIEPTLAVCLATSVTLFTFLAVWAWTRPTPKAGLGGGGIADKVYNNTVELEPVKPDEPEIVKDETKDDNKKPTKTASTKPKASNDKPKANNDKPVSAEDRAKAAAAAAEARAAEAKAAEDAVNAELETLASLESSSDGDGSRRLTSHDPGTSIDKTVKNIAEDGKDLSVSHDGTKARNVDNARITGRKVKTETGSKIESTGKTDGPKEIRAVVKGGRVKGGNADVTLTPQSVFSKINSRYKNGIASCWKRVLKTNPTASVKMTLKFKVGPSGQVTRTKVSGSSFGSFNSCLQNKAKGWYFGKPIDKVTKEPTTATFSFPLQLAGK